MATYFDARQFVVDSVGAAMGGAKLYFYATGTTTDKAVYTDEALSIAHAQPVVADSAGVFAAIFMNTDAAYSVVLKTSAGVTVRSADPHRPAGYPLLGTLNTRVNIQAASNPVYYGAIGDGAADESSYVQSAITNATGTVDLLGKTYRCDSQLTVPSNRRVINGTLDFSQCSATDGYIKIVGSLGSNNLLTSNAAAGDITLAVTSASGLAAGNVLFVNDPNTAYNGELVRMASISGTTATLTAKIINAYTTASTSYVAKLTSKSNIQMRDLTIIGASTAGSARYGIYAQYCENLLIDNVEFRGTYTAGISIRTCLDTRIGDCILRDANQAATGAGVEVRDCSQAAQIANCIISYSVFGIDVGAIGTNLGRTRDVEVLGCRFWGITSTTINLRAGCDRAVVSTCRFDYCSPSTATVIVAACPTVTVCGCRAGNCTGPFVSVSGTTYNSVIGNHVNGCSSLVTGGGTDSVIADNYFLGGSVDAHVVNGMATRSTLIHGNTLIKTTGTNHVFYASGGGGTGTLICRGNYMSGGAYGLISDTKIPLLVFSGNIVRSSSSAGFYNGGTLGNEFWIISNNVFGSISGYDILLGCTAGNTAPNQYVIQGNIFSSGNIRAVYIAEAVRQSTIIGNASYKTGSTVAAIDVSAAGVDILGLAVAGNAMLGGNRLLYLHNTANGDDLFDVGVAGNSFKTESAAVPVIDCAGATANDLSQIGIAGNALYGGTYGVFGNNADHVTAGANAIRGYATAMTSGIAFANGDNAT